MKRKSKTSPVKKTAKVKKVEAAVRDFPVWEDGMCGHCGFVDKEDPPYRLSCPECFEDGCDECMPAGRGCACPRCEMDQ